MEFTKFVFQGHKFGLQVLHADIAHIFLNF